MEVSAEYNFELVALDLDGTLLDSKGKVSERTAIAVQRVARRARIALCSGRAPQCMAGTALALQRHDVDPVLVACNGAVSYGSAADGRPRLAYHPLPPGAAQRLLLWAHDHERMLNCYVDHTLFAVVKNDHQEELANLYAELTGITYTFISSYIDLIEQNLEFSKMLLMGHDVDWMMEQLSKLFTRDDVSCLDVHLIRGEFFVEVLAVGVNKGAGLISLCQHLGVELERVVAFGDGWNDIEFIQSSGMGIAMKNGRDEVKAIADRVTTFTNDDDGVARELEFLLEMGHFGSDE